MAEQAAATKPISRPAAAAMVLLVSAREVEEVRMTLVIIIGDR